jgi:hypothetical protein
LFPFFSLIDFVFQPSKNCATVELDGVVEEVWQVYSTWIGCASWIFLLTLMMCWTKVFDTAIFFVVLDNT